MVATIVVRIPGRYLITPHFSAFYATRGWLAVALVLTVSLWSFHKALGGRKVWKGDFLED